MSAKRRVSKLERCVLKFSKRNAIYLLAALFLLGGIVFATPISSIGRAKLQDSGQIANHRNNQAGVVFGASSAVGSGSTPKSTVYLIQDGGLFAGSQYSTVKVPEPQSLVLFGTGLLSLAGLIRRRLVR
jgi:PEP-CTERM motif